MTYKILPMLLVRLQLIDPHPILSTLETKFPVLCAVYSALPTVPTVFVLHHHSDSALFPSGSLLSAPVCISSPPSYLMLPKLPVCAYIKHFLYILKYTFYWCAVDISLSFWPRSIWTPFLWVGHPPHLIFLHATPETENARYLVSQSSFH